MYSNWPEENYLLNINKKYDYPHVYPRIISLLCAPLRNYACRHAGQLQADSHNKKSENNKI